MHVQWSAWQEATVDTMLIVMRMLFKSSNLLKRQSRLVVQVGEHWIAN